MKYLRGTFTLPASSGRTTDDKKWDLAFLSDTEFILKYGLTKDDYIDGKTPE